MPPTGGLNGAFGTNPFAFAAPAGKYPAFLLDMSTSAIAGAKVIEARDRGETLPEGLLEDREGNPVTDPARFKIGETLLLPMSGVKGYGLTMMVDLLSTVLTGDDKWGHFIWVLNVEQFMPREQFVARMDAEIERIKGTKRKPGVDEIYYAGERGQRRMAKLRAAGRVNLSGDAVESLRNASESSSVAMPELTAGECQ
jgi:LDH2 family malate/lactate/ureidoglycolate dehydrogenase